MPPEPAVGLISSNIADKYIASGADILGDIDNPINSQE
jgi:hypothetical protein